MNPLPHGITDPLHIEAPFPTWTLLVAALGVWLLYRFLRYVRARRAAAAAMVPAPQATPAEDGRIGTVIEAIRRRTFERKDYRAGCHELAAALKEHLGHSLGSGVSLEHLTAHEIERRVGDTALSRFFGLLSRLQFFRRPPSDRDFDGACDLALDVVVYSTGTASRATAVRTHRGES